MRVKLSAGTHNSRTSCSTRDHSVAVAFGENGIGREKGDGSAQRGQSAIYDCLVLVLELDKCWDVLVCESKVGEDKLLHA